jgi:hypothetical protein
VRRPLLRTGTFRPAQSLRRQESRRVLIAVVRTQFANGEDSVRLRFPVDEADENRSERLKSGRCRYR